jgi:hypothetical protein
VGKAKCAHAVWLLRTAWARREDAPLLTVLSHSGARAQRGTPESITPVDAYHSSQWLWIPGSGFAGPGMMGWTAPDGIISAKLVVLIRNSKGDRP